MAQERRSKTALAGATDQLRANILSIDDGAFIGSEESVQAALGCARSTLRQAARVLESEGLLRVRRGINGGYFGSRPDVKTIEDTVASYLETIDVDSRDISMMAAALWIVAVRKATEADRDAAEAAILPLIAALGKIRETDPFAKLRNFEQSAQDVVFALGQSSYIKLIFDINAVFSWRELGVIDADACGATQARDARRWIDAKMLELKAIAAGDPEFAGLAARHARTAWHRLVIAHYSSSAGARAAISRP